MYCSVRTRASTGTCTDSDFEREFNYVRDAFRHSASSQSSNLWFSPGLVTVSQWGKDHVRRRPTRRETSWRIFHRERVMAQHLKAHPSYQDLNIAAKGPGRIPR